MRGSIRSTARAVGVGMMAMALMAGSALGQSSPPPVPELPPAAVGTEAARFAVAPGQPHDSKLTLITAERDCGASLGDPWTAAHVAESDVDVFIRLDVMRLPDGTACESDQQVRVPVSLESPIGDRIIRNAGSVDGEPALINSVDGIDTGFRYHCGGASFRIADLLGPGFEIGDDRPASTLDGARAVLDTGDAIEYLGPFRKNGSADVETWGFHDGAWQRWGSGTCRPLVELEPGRHGATWSLRGPRPGPAARELKIWVQAQPCHGSPPSAGQLTQPILQIRKDSIVIIMGSFFPNQLPDEVRGIGAGEGYAFIDCNGFGPSRYVVKLPQRLGNRKIYDGGVFPPQVRGGKR